MLLKALTVAFCVIGLAVAEQSPVFLWGVQSESKPSLQTIQQNEFANLLAPLTADHMIVAFQEESLSPIDLLCSNENSQKSCYAHLQGVSEKTYYASVQNPTDALRSLTSDYEYITVDKSGALESPLNCDPGKVVFINFAGDRDLEAHDVAINEITKANKCHTAYLYMSTPNGQGVAARRVRRDTAASNPGYIFREGSDFLLYFSNLFLINEGKKEEIIINAMTVSNKNASSFAVTLTDDKGKTLTFTITLLPGSYYSMNNLKYGDMDFYTIDINSLTTFSFFCGNLTLPFRPPQVTDIAPPKISLLWNSLQFQAPFGSNKGNAEFVFGDPWHCVGFFTPGILMGLFLLIILLFITFTGVTWMMDINTMDRFDDPKGKTITINVTE